MLKTKITLVVIFFVACFNNSTNAQKATIHDKINADIYLKFSEAFETLDYDLFASIHSEDMIRIAGNAGEIKIAKTYLEEYKKRWDTPNKNPPIINFRLFERVLSDSIVSDRGIYKVTYTNKKKQRKNSFGQFHILFKLENKNWKIILDYDSNENKRINGDSYNEAFALSDFKKYWKY